MRAAPAPRKPRRDPFFGDSGNFAFLENICFLMIVQENGVLLGRNPALGFQVFLRDIPRQCVHIHHVYTMNLDRLSLLRPLASDGRTRKNALSASARSVPLRSARSVPESIRCIIKLECGRWGTAQHGMLTSCAERQRTSTRCPV